ncbi:ROK family protein [Corynebacterium sp. 153RC1]|uniref:ROK family protein n=1 Tax=unclassified Corynebacterium TaxID=2624378 RepID=UPI00211CD287|nr:MULTISPECIES: ROK family protein [unclassified Corynebacterium]MCQ9352749.1 ROK family protein [Corynebacterium sp. 209RC1]MCQ9354933.1 ROK family protein [Corynebacterium sp. 1222RC1]MCQ9357194.1 ROK family protein [Corynebacterium sp. 122RC1]MCQ9359369.1 ROK family protein [Corynebacterium sp. 142RC1]MCQ9361591.1 ROK family protein [Corynebacterium sp. 153RC1]
MASQQQVTARFGLPTSPLARVLHQIRTTQSDRTLLHTQLGLSQASATRYVAALLDAGLVEEQFNTADSTKAGRPRITLRVDGSHLLVWGAHVGVSSAEIVICDVSGRIIRQRRLPLAAKHLHPKEHLFALATALQALAVGLPEPVDVGIAFSSHVDRQGCIDSSEYGWKGADVATLLHEAFGRRVTVATGVLAMAGAEIAATPIAGEHWPSTLYFYAREVVSHAWIFNGIVHYPHTGRKPSALRPGPGPHGLAPLSVKPILGRAAELGFEVKTFAELVEAAKNSEQLRTMFHERAEAMGQAIAAAVDFVDPEVVVCAGEAFTLDSQTLETTKSILQADHHSAAHLQIQQAERNIVQRAAMQVALNGFQHDPLAYANETAP